jgi:hypothetical protein
MRQEPRTTADAIDGLAEKFGAFIRAAEIDRTAVNICHLLELPGSERANVCRLLTEAMERSPAPMKRTLRDAYQCLLNCRCSVLAGGRFDMYRLRRAR